MNFKPKNDDELNIFDLFPVGEYDFEVIKAVNSTSKTSGDEMIKLELDIYATNGKKTRVFDYLLESLAYKLKHFCEATGLLGEYNAGNLAADICINRSGRCVLGIQKDKSGEYPDKNFVKDYCKQLTSSNKSNFDDISEEELRF